jgi:cytochrome c-type biogenesis protein CcmH
MKTFWIILTLLTLLAWGLILWPLYRKPTMPISKGAKLVIFIFPLVILGVYVFRGNSGQIRQYESWRQQSHAVQEQMALLKNPQELIARMRQHLQEHPQSAQGWYLLGKLYLDQHQYSEAQDALNHAHELKPDSAEYILYLAKADFFKEGGRLSTSMEALLQTVLESSLSERADAFNLLAVNAYRRQDFHQAVQYWQRALAIVPPDSPDSRALLDMISQAQKKEK